LTVVKYNVFQGFFKRRTGKVVAGAKIGDRMRQVDDEWRGVEFFVHTLSLFITKTARWGFE
jgi:hypothetical protein